MAQPPIPLVKYAAVPDGQMLFIRPPTKYASTPPGLIDFSYRDAEIARIFLRILARETVEVPAEAVMLYRDGRVLDGRFILTREGAGIEESFVDVSVEDVVLRRHPGRQAALAAGEAEVLPAAGPPVAAIFKEHCQTFGHVVGEMLPRLAHLAELGPREWRLLVPQMAMKLAPVIDFAVEALGMRATLVPCPEGSVLHVPALHWVSPVSRTNTQTSPTLMRLVERLRAAAPPADGPRRLFVTRPAGGRRPLTNVAALEAVAVAAGFAVVEPSALSVARQVALFAGAEWVAGPWGSGLVLSAAMAPGGRVTMIGSAIPDFFFWDIACLAGLRFDWVFTEPMYPDAPELFASPVTIAPALLGELLSAP